MHLNFHPINRYIKKSACESSLKSVREASLKSVSVFVLSLLLASIFTGCGSSGPKPFDPAKALAASELADPVVTESRTNPDPTLSVPCGVAKLDDTWFLVDCYHDRVIYSDTLGSDLTSWNVLTEDTVHPHTIAGDGTVILVDDTDSNRVLVFEKTDDGYSLTQTFSEIGNRPHFTTYDPATKTFYVWSSMSGEMYLFRRADDDSRVYLDSIQTIPELANTYIRSFTIDGDSVYFVSGISSDGSSPKILKCRLKDFSVEKRFDVPESMAGMVQISHIGDYFYITISTDLYGSQDYATMVRTKSLDSLADAEDIYSEYFVGGGTPYYMFPIDGSYYLCEHRVPGHSIWKFDVDDAGLITEVEAIY